MSVTTTFDEKRDEAKNAIGIAIKALQECSNEDTWGYDEIKPEFIDEIITMIGDLMKIKRKL